MPEIKVNLPNPVDYDTRAYGTRIYKYELPLNDIVGISMPRGAQVLCVQVQHGKPHVWAVVQPEKVQDIRRFYVVGTGHPFPVYATNYIGTFQLQEGRLVFHVFEPAMGS